MIIERRGFLIGIGATGLLAACQSAPKPAMVTVQLSGQKGMNPGPDGGDRPVTVLLLRLKSAGALNSADYFALQADPAAALGADLVGLDRLSVAPGGSASKVVGFEPEATTLGVVALVREPTGRTWRTSTPIAPKSNPTIKVTLGGGGISLGRG
jgi:type VI secretion system protein VasD